MNDFKFGPYTKQDFTEEANLVIKEALWLAKANKIPTLKPELLLWAFFSVDCPAKAALESIGLDSDTCSSCVLPFEIEGTVNPKGEYSEKIVTIFDEARRFADMMCHAKIGTEEILLGILAQKRNFASATIMTALDDKNKAKKLFESILVANGVPQFVAAKECFECLTGRRQEEAANGTPLENLEEYSRNMTDTERVKTYDPVVGREKELNHIIQILTRRTKNNPCLVGEPGVGKTAIVEQLARLITEGNVPSELKNVMIYSLDMSSVLAGTRYRGDFEERMKDIIAEVEEHPNIILFVDEIHTIMGKGGSEGTADAASILKPALSRGIIRMIGTTTYDEYQKHIEKDAAFARRFQRVEVLEPDTNETELILKGIRQKYEEFHNAIITDGAIKEIVRLSNQYINDRFQPDKSIDILDEVASRKHLINSRKGSKAFKASEEIAAFKKEREKALLNNEFEVAVEYAEKIKKAEAKLKRAKKAEEKEENSDKKIIDKQDCVELIAELTGIPIDKLKEDEKERLLGLEDELKKRVLGQDEAVTTLAKVIRRSRVGLNDPNRPIGSFLFLGPTGVGKTELSKALAQSIFGTEDALIRIDMSEYMEKHTISKLIGSPPGYVGFEEAGQLTEKIRRRPYSVVLFDELEKAHEDVFNILLQILDDGRLTDSKGRKVNFRNTIIIMTSNTGAREIMTPKHLGFVVGETEKIDYDRMKSGVLEELKRRFKPEFLNRIDDTIVFRQLGKDILIDIVAMQLKTVGERAKNQLGMDLTFTKELAEFILSQDKEEKYGARPIRRAIQTYVEDYISENLLRGELERGKAYTITAVDGKVSHIIYDIVR
ncbi:MAG: ATP-dependent Clp protease ATP-binding subunit [Lachnospiraceae bacterium]|nr:ATP-dependent Clp protease ATP-binding subunit [Lachnospiraceae bacterium]